MKKTIKPIAYTNKLLLITALLGGVSSELPSVALAQCGDANCGCQADACGQSGGSGGGGGSCSCGDACGSCGDIDRSMTISRLSERFMDGLDNKTAAFERKFMECLPFGKHRTASCDTCSGGGCRTNNCTGVCKNADAMPFEPAPMLTVQPMVPKHATVIDSVPTPPMIRNNSVVPKMKSPIQVPPAMPALDYQHDPFLDDAANMPTQSPMNRYIEAQQPSANSVVRVRIGGGSSTPIESQVVAAGSMQTQTGNNATSSAAYFEPSKSKSRSMNRYAPNAEANDASLVRPATSLQLGK